MGFFRAAICAVPFAVVFCSSLAAQDVTLTSRDGSVEITGTLLGYDGEFYRVASEYGELTVDGTGVLCSGPGCPDLEAFVAELVLSGSRVIGENLIPPLIRGFAEQQGYLVQEHPSDDGLIYELSEKTSERSVARILVNIVSSDEGFADLVSGDADISMSMRPVSAEEVARGVDAGKGRLASPTQNKVLALDALVPVVSPRNPVQAITPEHLAQVFAGLVTNWQELGGLDAPIDLFLPAADADALHVFRSRIMDAGNLRFAENAREIAASGELVQTVAGNPFAIGLALQSELSGVKTLPLAGGCGFRSAAVPESLKADDYPLTVPLFLYLRGGRLPAVGREFVRFTGSPAAQITILRAGYVDQAISRTPVARQGDRIANAIRAAGEEFGLEELKRLVDTLDGARRLSVTFRFDDGSAGLNAQSRSNIALLARALETGTVGGRELTFIGFSDGVGPAAANLRLSLERAASVKAAVVKEAETADTDRVRLKVDGFGEVMPMACDDSEWGRRINRRVEVWLR